jgi:CRISPR/Cas system CMR subunit Cmr6 (Cas7 group RAMP superfamily)
VHPDGSVVSLPKIPISKLKGVVKARRRASLEDMETAIGKGATYGRQRAKRR